MEHGERLVGIPELAALRVNTKRHPLIMSAKMGTPPRVTATTKGEAARRGMLTS
jgi:hypothetical protein